MSSPGPLHPSAHTHPHELCTGWPRRNLGELKVWCDERQIRRARSLEIRTEDENWGVFATRRFGVGEILCQIPKTAVLSIKTSSLPQLIPLEHFQPQNSHTIFYLSLCLLHEFRLGKESAFYGYLQCLPRDTPLLPSFWSIEELAGQDGLKGLEMIRGTEVERHVQFKANEGLSMNDARQFYTALSPHLPPTPSHPHPSPFLSFVHAFGLVCSRAFVIDLYHIIALCPIADLFNHSSSHPHTSLSSDDFVCHLCGSLNKCNHDIHSVSGIVLRLEHLSFEDRSRVEKELDTVDLRVEQEGIRSGDEIFNCYGENLGDGRLLGEWGFIEQDSTGGNITFNLDELPGKRKWEELAEKKYVELAVAEDEDRLLGPQSADQPWALTVDTEGVLSVDLFGAIVINELEDDVEDQEKEIQKIIHQVETAWSSMMEEDEGDQAKVLHLDLGETALESIEKVVDLLDARLKGLYRHDLPMSALFPIQDELDPKDKLQHMSMTALINERRLLESTREKWSDLLDMALAGGAGSP